MSSTRISNRSNKYKGSFYESDQEDNLKDSDYNPNEFYDLLKLKTQKEFPKEIKKQHTSIKRNFLEKLLQKIACNITPYEKYQLLKYSEHLTRSSGPFLTNLLKRNIGNISKQN
jgi:hypothetical protein